VVGINQREGEVINDGLFQAHDVLVSSGAAGGRGPRTLVRLPSAFCPGLLNDYQPRWRRRMGAGDDGNNTGNNG
jgi:hypothetical protein